MTSSPSMQVCDVYSGYSAGCSVSTLDITVVYPTWGSEICACAWKKINLFWDGARTDALFLPAILDLVLARWAAIALQFLNARIGVRTQQKSFVAQLASASDC